MRVVLSAIAALLLAAAGFCQVSPDDQTVFLCQFDETMSAGYSAGEPRASAAGDATLEEGKFGSALRCISRGVTYQGAGNLDPVKGTVEMWVQPLWLAEGLNNATLLTFRTSTGDYINFNVVRGKDIGIAVRAGGDDDWVWKRVETDITGWVPDQWRHLAATWGNGELHFFVDGEEVSTPITDLKDITGEVDTFLVAGGNMRIDALRIADSPRTAADIARAASPEPQTPQVMYASSLDLAGDGTFRADGLPDRAHLTLPLFLGDAVFTRGIGMVAPATVRFAVPEGFETLEGQAGASGLDDGPGGVALSIKADGKTVWSSADGAFGQFELQLGGVKSIELSAVPADPASRPMVTWADLILLKADASAPRGFTREAIETDLKLARLRLTSDKYSFPLPDGASPYVIFAKGALDAMDATTAPGPAWPERLQAFASRGESEPLAVLIAARDDLRQVTVTAEDLVSGDNRIASGNIDLRWVLRGPQRVGYWMTPDNTEVTSRFLMPFEPFDLRTGTMREIWLDIAVPADATPGTYEGAITVSPRNAEERRVPIVLRVLPIDLPETSRHKYGMYYRMGNALADAERGRLELEDMRRHGISTLFVGAGVRFFKDGDAVKHDCGEVRETLELMREAGYSGTVPVHDGLIALGRALGLDVGGKENNSVEGLEEDPQMLALARAAFDEVKQIDQEYPEFRLALTHMDEVFNNSRLPLYIQLAKIIRKTTDLPIYITHHTSPRSNWEEMMAQSDPYIDIRCMNGHALDEWLRAGHSFEELAQQGEESGDELWTYYNMRGSFFTAEWCRIVNGYYMWLSPLTVHVPWMYHSFGGDPFDDTDSAGYDFGYSVPSPKDGKTPVPTLHMKGSREGIDDMRYLELLEDLITRAKQKDEALAADAEKWLARLHSMMPKIPEQIQDIEGESPVLIWISQNYTHADYQRLRYGTAEQIMKLQEALK